MWQWARLQEREADACHVAPLGQRGAVLLACKVVAGYDVLLC